MGAAFEGSGEAVLGCALKEGRGRSGIGGVSIFETDGLGDEARALDVLGVSVTTGFEAGREVETFLGLGVLGWTEGREIGRELRGFGSETGGV